MKVWLDDTRPAPDGWVWCKTYDSAIRYLSQHWSEIEVISLDHDLGTEKNGHDVFCYIERRVLGDGLPLTMEVRVHSANSPGAKKIKIGYMRLLERQESG